MRCYILNDNAAGCKNQLSDEELIKSFLSGDDDAFEVIVSRYLGLISTVAKKYRGISSDTDDSDMIQEGMVALLSACRSYDAQKGMSFKNYLVLCVENRYRTMLRSCARQSAVPARNMIS